MDLLDNNGQAALAHVSGEDLTVRLKVVAQSAVQGVAMAIILQTLYGMRVITSWTREVDFPVDLSRGHHWYECRFRRVPLRPGHTIRIDLWMAAHTVLDSVENAGVLDIACSEDTRHLSPNGDQGVVVCDYEWAEVTDPDIGRSGLNGAAATGRCVV